MTRRLTGGETYDYCYEGKPEDYAIDATSDGANELLQILKRRGVIDSWINEANDKSFLFIALSMNLPKFALRRQLTLCGMLIMAYRQTTIAPSIFPRGVRDALQDCCYEDKLQVYDRKTQLKMFVALKILNHPSNTDLDTNQSMRDEAEGFLAFCLTEDLSGPGEGFKVGEEFERLYRAYTESIGRSLSFNCYHAVHSSPGMRC